MPNYVLLNPDTHRHLCVSKTRGAEFGESVNHVPIVADELETLALEYPIGFLKDHETGQFGMHAVLGFLPHENLFLNGNNWNATAIPLHVLRQPFLLARSESESASGLEHAILSIDMDSKRVSTADGVPLFDEEGKPTEFLNGVQSMLSTITTGIKRTEHFIQALLRHNLLEPVQLSITMAGESHCLDGLYAISKTNAKALSDDVVVDFFKLGYLNAIYLIVAASGNFRKLSRLRQQSAG